MQEIRLVNLTSSVSRSAGGLFESVRHLARETLIPGRCRISAVGLEDDHSAEDLNRWQPVDVRACKVVGPNRFGYSPAMATALRDSAPDLVHLHGVWKYPSLALLLWARRTRKPYIISPHGMLEPWSLRQSRTLKRVATLLYQGACLREAMCLRATSQMECESIRKAGYSNPVAIVPNGVEVPGEVPPRRPSRARGRRRALFLSRIHPKKGLLNLVKAWQKVRPAGWELHIVGPDEAGRLAQLRRAVEDCGLQGEVLFPGEVWGPARTQCYADSDLFVLPSYSENFGLVIAEALSCEVPVITTRATPWQELEQHNCGWWIDTGVEPLAAALREAMAHSPSALREMGRRGRDLIKSRYTWGSVGEQMVQVYEWMAGRGPQPAFVQ